MQLTGSGSNAKTRFSSAGEYDLERYPQPENLELSPQAFDTSRATIDVRSPRAPATRSR